MGVVNAVARVTPLTEQDQSRRQRIEQQVTTVIDPLAKRAELWMQRVPRQKSTTILHAQDLLVPYRNSYVCSIELFFDNHTVRKQFLGIDR